MKNSNGKGKIGIVLLVLIVIIAACVAGWYFTIGKDAFNDDETTTAKSDKEKVDKVQGEEQEEVTSEFLIKDNSLGAFDLEFLKLENDEINKIYSPLSIKYTLGMLNEAAGGASKSQISSVIGEYIPRKVINSKNISFANSFFVRDEYESAVKDKFMINLEDKFGAEVVFDSFASAHNVNSWISDKTLGLIDNALNDSDVESLNFALVNALAIDMDWEDKFLAHPETCGDYDHEKFGWIAPQNLIEGTFEGVDRKNIWNADYKFNK